MTNSVLSQPVDEDVAVYSITVAPAYQSIRRLLIQFAGILLLQNGSNRSLAVDPTAFELSADRIAELTHSLAMIRPPFRLRPRHAGLLRCVEELRLVDKHMRNTRAKQQTDPDLVTMIRAKLDNVLAYLKASESHATNLTVVDFRQTCACHSYISCEHAGQGVFKN